MSKRIQPGDYVECASATCWKMFQRGEGSGLFCSRTCQRNDERLRQNSEALGRALAVMRELDTTDIYDVVGRRKVRSVYQDGRIVKKFVNTYRNDDDD